MDFQKIDEPHAAKPTFSVIIPVYNTAAYLESCIRSVLDQDNPDLEVIAVDDGSTDESLHILTTMSKDDPRLRIFSKPNGGQGSARNLGLTHARGGYVAFVDSDDTIAVDLLSRVAQALSHSSLDIVSFGIEFRDDRGRIVASRGPAVDFKSTGDVIFLDAMLDRNFLTSVCNKVYRRTLLINNAVVFPELRAFEDSVFSRHVAQHAHSVRYLKERLYIALTRGGSTSRGITALSFSRAAEMIKLERKMFYVDETNPMRKDAFRAHVARFLSYLLILAAFRIDDPAERSACYRIANEAGFADCATDRQALALLSPRARAQIFIARYPLVLRTAALAARRFNRSPY